jgi:hypothetical protein
MLYTIKSTNVAFAGIVLVQIQVIAVDYDRYVIAWICYFGKRKYVPWDVLNYATNEHKPYTNAAINASSENDRRGIEASSAVTRCYWDKGR